MGKRPQGTCALCQKQALLCKSHIIPEFLYEPLYDKVFHRLDVLSTDPKRRTYPIPKGIYQYLLCEQCETLTGRWESYAKLLLYGGTKLGWIREPRGPVVHGIDYPRFKLFQMTMLWRCHATRRAEFQEVDLGPKHGERLRQMILASDPGKPGDYGCVLMAAPKMTYILKNLIWTPKSARRNGQTKYMMMAGQLFWFYFVQSPGTLAPQNEYFLKTDGTLQMVIGSAWAERQLKMYARRFQLAGKLN